MALLGASVGLQNSWRSSATFSFRSAAHWKKTFSAISEMQGSKACLVQVLSSAGRESAENLSMCLANLSAREASTTSGSDFQTSCQSGRQ